ncbi:orotidine-5'-phosphate decarboxylase [Clostridium pascui]|uniref:orotidine-5'-phosphate decarboxylase n=1 Tax=Clostridium pascui TaxID=46609 RepID=UPI0019578181|nr:orotidine-5'-phosphate decarboxylase [Clostridium pascui]MBM7871870.1 orotidine-5'-phosphate decarboxylase [Clostridium pascui]
MLIDRLYEEVQSKGNVCVGLDTCMEYIPKDFKDKYYFEQDALFRFNQRIIDATADIAACFKVQIAYYEALGIKGLMAYKKTLEYIRSKGSIAISDIKRGDISSTASMYAKGHFEGDFETDFITLSPYMGMDSIEPYLNYVKEKEKGMFVLVRTSNEGAKDIEFLNTKDGKKVYETVGEKLEILGGNFMGKCGYSSIGGVVGCTHREDAVEIRKKFNNTFFLIPGYGAQGGTEDDVSLYLNQGNGGVVNSSRGILLAYKKCEDSSLSFEECSRMEAVSMRDKIRKACLK